MPDNSAVFGSNDQTPPSGFRVATKQLTFSGDTADIQVTNPVGVTGSEGSWTLRNYIIADDAAFTPATDAVVMIGAEFDDSSPDSVDEGDAGALRMSGNRNLYTTIRDAAGNERGLNVDSSGAIAITVATIPSHAVTNAGTFAVQAAQSGTWTVDLGSTDNAVLDSIAALLGTIDTDTGNIDTDTGNIVTSVQLLDDTVYVDDADWTDSTSKHLLVGGLYQSSPQTVTDGDVAPFNITTNGALHVAVQNTLTVASHAVTNAGTFAVQAAQSGTWNITNVSGTVSLPTGAATAAKQPALGTAGSASTDVITVQGISSMTALVVDGSGVTQPVSGTVTANLSATDNAVLDTIASPVATVSSTPLQRVAIFDASDAQITSFGGGTQYTEDAAAAGDPVGNATILIRKDTPAGITTTDGDNVAQRGTDYGAAYVQVVDSSGNFIDTFGGSGGTAAADDADFTAGTTQGTPGMGVYESSPTSVTDGDLGTFGITQTRQIRVSAVQEGTWDEVGINDSGNSITVDWAGTAPPIGAGTEATALRVTLATDSTGVVSVDDNGGALTVDNGGTFAVQVDGNALTALQLIDDIVYVDDADWTDSTSKHALVGGLYQSSPQTITDGDVAPFNMTSTGAMHVAVQNTVTVASHAVTNAGTFAVQVSSALPAGTNAIGKLAANSGVDIGDVDILSIIPGTGATNLGKAEDAAHSSGDTGVMALGVRAAAPTERSAGPTDGDYEPFATNEVGAIWVSVTPSANGGVATMNASSSDGATALTNSAQAIKASAGTLRGYYIYNPNSAAAYVQIYNTASGSVTVGTTNPLFMLTIPPVAAANLSIDGGVAFSTAISWAATSTAGGNGALTTALDAVAWYK